MKDYILDDKELLQQIQKEENKYLKYLQDLYKTEEQLEKDGSI